MPVTRLHIQAASIPLLSTHADVNLLGRTRGDNAYTGAEPDGETAEAQMTYAHNVMPAAFGVKSVGYEQRVKEHRQGLEVDFSEILVLRDSAENQRLLAPAQGRNYLLSREGNWAQLSRPEFLKSGFVTKAYVPQRTFIHYAYAGTQEYDAGTNSMAEVELQSIEADSFLGITASNGYLIGYDSTTVYWSSPIDPTDFTPSLATGAGSARVTAARGTITCVLPIHDGYIIYTTRNAVAATYSNNSNFPWNFREIPNSNGVVSPRHVSYDSNLAGHYAWTTGGIQLVAKGGANLIAPEVADFLRGDMLEEWIGPHRDRHQAKVATGYEVGYDGQLQAYPEAEHQASAEPNLLRQYSLPQHMRLQVKVIGARFVVISYGWPSKLTHAIVYDIGLKRYGKLRFEHTDAFEYVAPDKLTAEFRHSIGLLRKDGSVYTCNTDEQRESLDSVIMFGPLQAVGGTMTQINGINISTAAGHTGSPFELEVATAIKSSSPLFTALPFRSEHGVTGSSWKCRCTGQRHFLILTGSFNLTGVEIDFQGVSKR